jgi:hypothetical protein
MKNMTDVREISGMRASDHDRQEVVDLLRGALDDGRLTLEEYLDRMAHAYQAVTHADLVPLCADLPAGGPARAAAPPATPAAAASPAVEAPGPVAPWWGAFVRQPAPLRVLWTIWLISVSVNVVVWALVSVTTASLIYPWPMWVAGPYGAVLLALSASAVCWRYPRRSAGTPRSRRQRGELGR